MQLSTIRWGVAGAGVLVALAIAEHFSYLFFHSLVELFSVIVSIGIFVMVWNLDEFIDDGYLRLLGPAFLAVGWLDCLHLLAYKGMGVFPGSDANLAAQLWVAARLVQSVSLLAAPLLAQRRLKLTWLTGLYTAVAIFLTYVIFGSRLFPVLYVEGSGLTTFKVASEYVISLMFLGGLLALVFRQPDRLAPGVRRLMVASLVLSIFAEVAFSYYRSVYDWINVGGHVMKLGAFLLIYLALIRVGLRQPASLFFQSLKRHQSALQEERDFYSAVVDTAGALVVILDPAGRIVRLNRAAEALTGCSTAEAAGKHPWDLFVPPGEADAVRQAFAGLGRGEFPQYYEMHWVTRSGDLRLISWTHTAIAGENRLPGYIIASGMDITERRQTEVALQEREERLRVIIDSVQTGMVLVDTESSVIADANPAFLAMVGLPADQVIGRLCDSLINPGPMGAAGLVAEAGPLQEQKERVIERADGRQVPVMVTALPVHLAGKSYLLQSVVDISERKLLEEELRTLSLVDDLTGLYNRRGFIALAGQQARTAGRLGRGLVLLFLDLDDLKLINDQWGHAAGDQALITLASVLRQTFRESDVVARLGGDEFAVLTMETSPTDGELLAARMMQNLEALNAEEGRPYRLSVSVGTARWTADEPYSLAELLTEADRRMYARKRARHARAAREQEELPSSVADRT